MIQIENKGKACREAMLFINALGERYRSMLPEEVLELIQSQQDPDHHPEWETTIHANSNARDLNLLHETVTLIAWLNLEYWEQDEKKKKELREIYEQNGRMQEMEALQREQKE